jgi:hypothetical protein
VESKGRVAPFDRVRPAETTFRAGERGIYPLPGGPTPGQVVLARAERLEGGAPPNGLARSAWCGRRTRRQLLPGRRASVLDERPGGRERPEVTGLGKVLPRRLPRGQSGDRGHQAGQAELVQDGGHPLLSLCQPCLGELPVLEPAV